jgi:asparagine synthase (glutamine-hydrolysing)
LVYRATDQGIWFGSHVDQLLQTYEGAPKPDDSAVVEYLLGRFRTTTATFFEGIKNVPPGHIFSTNGRRSETRRYWFPNSAVLPLAGSKAEYYAEVRRLLTQAVERCLSPHSPTLAHVSGGVDSSSIAVLAGQIARDQRLPTPAVIGVAGLFPGLACDEESFIAAVANTVPFPLERWNASDVSPIELEDPRVEGPGGRASFQGGSSGDLLLAQKHGARTILCGLGGDELMASTGIIEDSIAGRDWPFAFRHVLFFEGATTRTRMGRLKHVVRWGMPTPVRRFVSRRRAMIPPWLDEKFRDLARDVLAPTAPEGGFASHVQEVKLAKLASADFARPVGLLQRHAADFGVEYRFPFVDRDLVDFVTRIPYVFWPPPKLFARLHREVLKDILPAKIANRFGKAEFSSAVAAGLKSSRGWIEAAIRDTRWASERYTDPGKLRAEWQAIVRSEVPPARTWRRLRAAFTLEAWMRKSSGLSFPPKSR